ncbi:MAG: hypothetical protein Q8784_02270 [Vigna little leaf phytoplasma]|nr:hypothetical protein [Vigna little leaf phytoplasma]
MTAWDEYTFDEVVKATDGVENVYYFWRTPLMANIFNSTLIIDVIKINPNDPQSNAPRCPSFAKLLTQADIDNLGGK